MLTLAKGKGGKGGAAVDDAPKGKGGKGGGKGDADANVDVAKIEKEAKADAVCVCGAWLIMSCGSVLVGPACAANAQTDTCAYCCAAPLDPAANRRTA